MLAWESGLAAGLFVGYALLSGHEHQVLCVALGVVVLALALYVGFVHSWYMRNKNR